MGLLKMTILSQGATNLIAHFCRVLTRVLKGLILNIAHNFIDNIRIKRPFTNYNNEESYPGIHKFVLEHLINIDKILTNCELVNVIINGAKSH